ncbi:MAG TPA: hypothetical protein VF230_13465 [Acidimicrobiales bacterium]
MVDIGGGEGQLLVRLSVCRTVLAALLTVVAVALVPAAALAQTASPCPPGQPPGRPPGVPPGPPAGTPPSGRGQYPPGECNLRLSQSAAQRGQTVGTSGSGFVPGEVVAMSLQPGGQSLGTTTANAQGEIAHDVVIPADAPLGENRVLAASATRELSASLEVVATPATSRSNRASAPTSTAGGSLARTGVAIAGTVTLGSVLVMAGVLILGAARRRTEAKP